MSRLSFTYAQERCVRLAGKLMQQTGMIRPGARVGVAVSGGMDSWALLQVLRIRQRIVPFTFSIMALHVNPGFAPDNHAPLNYWLRNNGLAGHVELHDHGPRAHSEENRKRSACFYCAMLRRKRLFELCRQYKLSHLAFGHNAEDLVSSFMLNLCRTGRVEGMSMKEDFFNGALRVIRPLLLVEKKLIKKAVAQWELPVWHNPCPSAGNTGRSDIMRELEAFCDGHKGR
ncbi:tRNA 2-thiocytidine biosynthesis TtcA family protein, partial [Desulfovibrio sp. OttesenSCG-928-A18]|nr:tRNA 2-thiocytidine biosynthesis TtcA family protein [Desulfovibrio sp. OttesenSCG-928-A18]